MAALAGAAQLGVAYGLGILLWNQQYAAADPAWAINLTWACWLAAVSVVGGAVAGGWLLPRDPQHPGVRGSRAQRFGVAFAAGCGGALTVLLVAVPARYAQLPAVEPVVTAGRTAAIGVVIGVLVALMALVARPLSWNALAAVAWLWVLALVAVGAALRDSTNPDGLQLAVWGGPGRATGWTPTLVPMLVSAAVIGIAAGVAARRTGASKLVTATCGAPGPLLVATAYLVAGPGAGDRGPQFFPYLAAPYAVLAGLLGSLLVVAFDRRGTTASEEAGRPEASASTVDSEIGAAYPGGRHAVAAVSGNASDTATTSVSSTTARKASTRKAQPAKADKPVATGSGQPTPEATATPETKPEPKSDTKPGEVDDWPAQLREPEPATKRRSRRTPKR